MMGDVLVTEDALLEAVCEGSAHRALAVDVEEVMELVDIARPDVLAPIHDFCQVLDGACAEPEQMLALRVQLRAVAACCDDALRPVFGQCRALAVRKLPRMLRDVPAGDE